ncbi:MAG: hypothetical protein FWD09_09515, partial [Lentimicrobiaceae bacterium]|nr:hypothetical protein [Lentimicrobiaceae bacterium]
MSAQWPPGTIGGDGFSEATAWEITTIQHLIQLAAFVNAGNGSQTAGIYYQLMDDIAYPNPAIVIGSSKGWNPIGNNATSGATFQGNFNGNGKVVSNIFIDQIAISYIGLFGCVSNAEIKNLGVEVHKTFIGNQYVGGLIGVADNSTIENCYVISSVPITGTSSVGGLIGHNYSSTIRNSYAICDVSGVSTVGGLVGVNNGTVETSYADVDVNATGNEAGGFVGANYATIEDCYATGDVTGTASSVGGFVGFNGSGTITYCYATGDVTAMGGDFIGGLVGYNKAALRNCVAANDAVDGGSNANRVTGINAGGTLSNNYAYNGMSVNGTPVSSGAHGSLDGADESMSTLMSLNFYTGSNWFGDIWSIDTNNNSAKSWKICDGLTLPFLQWEGIACTPPYTCDFTEYGTGAQGDPYQIYFPCQLKDLANYVNGGGATVGMYLEVMDDLDLAGISNWNPIGNTSQSF